jgi:hypothetical protein
VKLRSLPLPGMEQSGEIRQQDIHRIVLERLQGYEWRQAIREYVRKKKRERKYQKFQESIQGTLYAESKENVMPMKERCIKVTYRATFQGPIGALNPSGLNADKAEVPVELRETPRGWIACKPEDRGVKGIFTAITAQPSAAGLQSQMKMYFRTRLTEWETWTASGAIVPMKREEYVVRDGKVYVMEEVHP